MRLSILVTLALASCGSSSAPPHTLPPPDRAKLEAMSWEERCAAVAPRATPCMDDILIADIAGLDLGSDLEKTMSEDIQRAGRSSAKALDAMHRAECGADGDYPFIVASCWSRPDCKQFGACIQQERKIRAARRRQEAAKPDEPAEHDQPAGPAQP